MLKPWCMFTLIWYTFWECIKICTDLVMAQCLNFWLLVCFLQEQDWLWNNSSSIALLQRAYRRHFLASVHFHVDLIHCLWVHQDLHTSCHGPVFKLLTTCLLLAVTRLAMKQFYKHSTTARSILSSKTTVSTKAQALYWRPYYTKPYYTRLYYIDFKARPWWCWCGTHKPLAWSNKQWMQPCTRGMIDMNPRQKFSLAI